LISNKKIKKTKKIHIKIKMAKKKMKCYGRKPSKKSKKSKVMKLMRLKKKKKKRL
jgi:hypothetical protein